jgi:hypothetical protein
MNLLPSEKFVIVIRQALEHPLQRFVVFSKEKESSSSSFGKLALIPL